MVTLVILDLMELPESLDHLVTEVHLVKWAQWV
jgi:hypothetical protein